MFVSHKVMKNEKILEVFNCQKFKEFFPKNHHISMLGSQCVAKI
jgi:hypothetical protein